MDGQVILNAISTVGFPIVCCAALFWYMKEQNEMHMNETSKLREAVENNTLAITKLLERLGGDKNE